MLKRYIGMFAVAMVTVHLPQSHVWCLVHSTLCSKAVLFSQLCCAAGCFSSKQENKIYLHSLLVEFESKSKYYFYFCSSS